VAAEATAQRAGRCPTAEAPAANAAAAVAPDGARGPIGGSPATVILRGRVRARFDVQRLSSGRGRAPAARSAVRAATGGGAGVGDGAGTGVETVTGAGLTAGRAVIARGPVGPLHRPRASVASRSALEQDVGRPARLDEDRQRPSGRVVRTAGGRSLGQRTQRGHSGRDDERFGRSTRAPIVRRECGGQRLAAGASLAA
jgi:hypothetical protein